jgi:hypothetical protein
MLFKPYKNIDTAIQQYGNDYYLRTGEVKIKCHKNIYKDERALIDAAILCKVFRTFELYYDELINKYNVKHVGHTFWDYTTWQLKYKRETYTFEIHSSNFCGQPNYISQFFEDMSCCKADIATYANFLQQYITDVLKELNYYAPKERYNSIYEHIQAIAVHE